jgi:hypothetical protein
MNLRLLLTGAAMTVLCVIPEQANAQIETLVMPGEVIEGHAEYEEDCDACHAKFKRAEQRTLCLACHEEVAGDVSARSGFHGLSADARDGGCATCHTDHEGRDADIVQLDEASFDHEFTDFPLLGKHEETECGECHEAGVRHRDAPSDCLGCHEADNVHGDTMGTECADCHTAAGWADAEFDHDTTEFSLIGRHAEAECSACHEDRTFKGAPTACFDCHAENDAHDGRSGRECGNCHAPTGWTDTKFNHARDTLFALDGRHAELGCGDCHSEDPFDDEMDIACVACHVENDNHDGHFGTACETCHSSKAWTAVHFDHDVDTGHMLNGAHELVECQACHVQPVFEVKPQTGCLSCHEEDDAHNGTQGTSCLDCHNENSWTDQVFFDHGLTRFPLLGAHADEQCDACHETHVFSEAPTDCRECHRDSDPHADRFPKNCALCHNPVGWLQWQFDHDRQTDFALQGAHLEVRCDSCHRRPLAAQSRLGSRCADCHRSDDVHDGEFGFDCGRCHSAESFQDVRSIQ